MSRSVRVLATSALLLASVAGAARAGTPTWVPVTGPAAGSYGLGAVSVAPANSAVAAWYKDVFTATPAIKIISLSPGPGAPDSQTVNPTILTNTAFPPSVAIAPTNDALVAWSNDTTVGYTLRQAPGTTFEPPLTLGAGGQNTAHNIVYPNVVATGDASGDFLVAFDNHLDATFRTPPTPNNLDRLVVFRVSGSTGLATGPVTVDQSESTSSSAYFSDLSMSEAPDGTALLSYSRSGTVYYVHRTGGDDWSAPQTVAGVSGLSASALGPTGRGLLAGIGASHALGFRYATDGSLAALGGSPFPDTADHTPVAALDLADRGTIAWHTTGGMDVQRVKADGSLDGPVQLVPETGGGDEQPQLAVAPGGAAFMAWSRKNGPTDVIESARRESSGAAMGVPTLVPDGSTGSGVTAGVDSVGDATAAWTDAPGTPTATPRLARQDAAPPSVTPVQITNGPPDLGTQLGFDVTTSDRTSAVTVRWSFGDGGTATGEHVTHAYTRRAKFTVSAVATDAGGYTASSSTTIDLGTSSGGGGGKPKARPKFTAKVKASHLTFAVAPKHRKKHPRHPYGTSLSFKLSGAATVKLTVARLSSGRRSHGRCAAPSHKLRKARKCTRAVGLKGSVSKQGKSGKNTLAFSGKLRGKALTPGRYRLSVQASNAAGRSKAATLTVRIVSAG